MHPGLFFSFVVFLATSGKCQNSVEQEVEILKEIFQKNEIYDDDSCDMVVASIDGCVDCYPCQHEIILSATTHKEIKIRNGQNCIEEPYLKLCCVPKGTKLDATPDLGTRLDPATCGVRHTGGLEVESRFGDRTENTLFREYNWVVVILDNCNRLGWEYRCVGTLINSRTVLTAAHCVCGMERQKCALRVRAGEYNFDSEDERFAHVEVDVQRIIKHEKFYDPGLHNDIALLILKDVIEPRPHIGFACLPDAGMKPDPNEKCIVAGWGVYSKARKPPKHRDIMRSIKLSLLDRDECEQQLRSSMSFSPEYKLDESFRCAINTNGSHVARGDGGAALVCPLKGDRNRFVQYGIVALGRSDGMPSLFVDTTKFRNWIDQKVDENIHDIIKDPYIITV